MKENRPNSRSQLLNFAKDSYLERTSRPIYALFFLLPFIIFYELGTIFIRSDVFKQSPVLVDSFVWLQKVSGQIGFGSKFAMAAPPLVVIIILIALQITSGKKWRLWAVDFLPMGIECILLSVPLIVLTLLLNSLSVRMTRLNIRSKTRRLNPKRSQLVRPDMKKWALNRIFLLRSLQVSGRGFTRSWFSGWSWYAC